MIELPGTQPAYASGQNSGNFIAKAADSAANFACSLYKAYPGTIIKNPADSYLRGLYDSLCKDRPSGLPAPPTQPFSGGQCVCRSYRVTVEWLNGGDDAAAPASQTYTVFGPVKGVEIRDEGASNRLGVYLLASSCSNGAVTGTFAVPVGPTPRKGGSASVAGVVPATNFTDNCGNPPASYPNDVKPPTGYTSGNSKVTYNDGTDVTVPVVYAPISPQFDINPRFNIDVGGIQMQFDLGGVTIDLGNDNPDTSVPRDRFNDPSDDFDRVEDKLDDLTDKVNDIIDRIGDGPGNNEPPPPPEATPPDEDPNLDKETKDETDDKEETGVERLKWVKIVLTKLPDKVQYGDGSPNCYFAGWFEFKSGVACMPREQINFATSLFLAPAGADGYAYTLTNGAEGYAVVYRKKETA